MRDQPIGPADVSLTHEAPPPRHTHIPSFLPAALAPKAERVVTSTLDTERASRRYYGLDGIRTQGATGLELLLQLR